MSKAKWSPEPWKLHTELIGGEPFYEAKDAEDQRTADITGDGLAESDEANGRRIVACVNACQGIPTEALESGALGKALELLASGAVGEAVMGPSAAGDVLRSLGRLK